MSKNGKSKEYWEARCAELEAIINVCAEAFELIPIWAIERHHDWHPSDVALLRLKQAKDSVRDYLAFHSNGGNGVS